MRVDQLVYARWIVPVEPANEVLDNHAIAISEGKIVDLIPAADAERKFTAAETRHLVSHALLPGFINAHTHATMTLFRGLANDLHLMDWLNHYIWPAENRWVDTEFVEDGTRHAIAEMLRNGTTCFNDMYFFPGHTAEIAVACGIRATVGLILIDFPTAWARNADEYLRKGEEVHDKYRHNPLIHTAFAPHAPYTVSDEPLKRISTIAEELDIPIHMHVHETRHEIDQSMEQYGKRPLQRLFDLGLLNERLLAVHMTQLEADEIELLAKYGVHVLHCPESNLKLASGFCPVAQLQQAGVNLALGTDGAASNNDLDMIGEMRTAALLAKGVSGDSTTLPAHIALEMATINGARALGIDSFTGSLVKGKDADIVAIDLDQVETQPLYEPVSQIVYAANRNQVSDVWVAGKVLLRDHGLTTIDEHSVLEKTSEWQKRIISANAADPAST